MTNTKWNIGDQAVVETTVTPHPSNPSGVASAVSCTFTKPDKTAMTPVTMTLDGSTWRCTGPTFDQAGVWRFKVAATAGLIGAESGTFTVLD